MKVLSFIFIAVNSFILPAEAQTFKVFEDEKYQPVEIQTYKGMRLTKNCFKASTPNCDAFLATQRKMNTPKEKAPILEHPASAICFEQGGLNRIVLSSDNKQYDYCLFKDESMINSWDLYNSLVKK